MSDLIAVAYPDKATAETVRHRLGQLMLTAISSRDYPTVVAVTLVFAVFVMVVNLLTDLLVAFLDSRARAAMVTAR